jgi:hypothetical protein
MSDTKLDLCGPQRQWKLLFGTARWLAMRPVEAAGLCDAPTGTRSGQLEILAGPKKQDNDFSQACKKSPAWVGEQLREGEQPVIMLVVGSTACVASAPPFESAGVQQYKWHPSPSPRFAESTGLVAI